jgi:hypothetical protein
LSILERINKIHKFFLNQNVFIPTTKNAKFGVLNQVAHFLVANVEKKTFPGFQINKSKAKLSKTREK